MTHFYSLLKHTVTPALFIAASVAVFNSAQAQAPLAANYQQIPFSLHPDTEKMLVLDLDRDGLQDLVAVQGHTLSIYFQNVGIPGFDFSHAHAMLELPGDAVGWDFPDTDNAPALIALIDGQRVLQWQINNRQFTDAEELIAGLGGFLGKGAYQLQFYQDINNDNLPDLLVPGAGVMNLLIQNPNSSFQPPLTVQADVRQRVVLQPGNELDREIGQAVRIPRMQLRDVNGDNLPDLISDTDTRFDVFLASGNGDYFPTLPSYSIDRETIRERLGEFDVDQLDFSNLTGVLALTHEELLRDMNGDGIDDFILREGGRVALHLGQANGMNLETPDQILRSSGNVLSVFLADENEDGRPDLWLWRVDQVSIGDLFLWLAVSGTINIEAFVYPNEGNQFARRPSRRITVAMRFPSAVRLIGSVQEVRDRAAAMPSVIPYERARIMASADTAAAAMDDMVVLMHDQLEVFFQALEPETVADEDRFLASLGYQRNRDAYEIDLRRLIDAFNVEVNQEVNAARMRQADLLVPLPEAATRGDIVATDLNNNAHDDVFVFTNSDSESVRGVLFLSD